MSNGFTSFLNKFDLVGVTPQLLIFNNKRYKSILSSIISILILIFSIGFGIFSFIEYLKFENPSIVYSKDNDQTTKRLIDIKDTLFMFQVVRSDSLSTLDSSIVYFEAEYFIIYDNGTQIKKELNIETCEFGKNVDMKYKGFIRDKDTFHKSLEDFYCISFKNGDISLFYLPNVVNSFINLYTIIKNNDKGITPEKIQTFIVTESDTINHNNKTNPINKNYIYYLTTSYSSSEYTKINYDFQYIKYESDEGLFYRNSKNLTGISFFDMTFYKNVQDDYILEENFKNYNESKIGTIIFGINKIYFDNYRRVYQRLQSLLAEIMSVANLFFEIGTQISIILCYKKMNTDIISNILDEEKKGKESTSPHNHNINDILKRNMTSSERKIIKQESIDKLNNNPQYLNKNEKNNAILLNSSKNKISRTFQFNEQNFEHRTIKKVNYFHIIKSFFCFKDKVSKLINLSHDIINEDLSVERILERFYNLESVSHFYLNEENNKHKIIKNKRFKEVNKYIDGINSEINKSSKDDHRKKIKKKEIEKSPTIIIQDIN